MNKILLDLLELKKSERLLINKVKSKSFNAGQYHRLICDNMSNDLGLSDNERLYLLFRLSFIYINEDHVIKQVHDRDNRINLMLILIGVIIYKLYKYHIEKKDIYMLLYNLWIE